MYFTLYEIQLKIERNYHWSRENSIFSLLSLLLLLLLASLLSFKFFFSFLFALSLRLQFPLIFFSSIFFKSIFFSLFSCVSIYSLYGLERVFHTMVKFQLNLSLFEPFAYILNKYKKKKINTKRKLFRLLAHIFSVIFLNSHHHKITKKKIKNYIDKRIPFHTTL